MIKIGVIGCGKWSKTVIKEINKSHRFKLKAIVCRSQNKIAQNKDIDIFNNVNDLIESNKCNCLYVAANPSVNFEEGLSQTIDWYLDNTKWLKNVITGDYLNYYKAQK